MSSCLVVLAEGFEELEAVAPIDLLRRAGVSVTLASLTEGPAVTGRSNLALRADCTLDAVLAREFDLILLPGGPGIRHLRADQRVRTLVLRQHARGSLLAAICAAPTLLADVGILQGRRYTAHPSVANELPAIIAQEAVVRADNVITSRGAGTSIAFGLALVSALCGEPTARQVAGAIAF